MKLQIFAGALSLVLVVGCASTGSQTFRRLDSNRDGHLTEAEFYAHVTSEGFRQLDGNRDGRITRAEWLAKEPADTGAPIFRALDSNRDGSVDLKEFAASKKKRAYFDRVFHTLDANQNGKVEWTEINTK